MMINMEESSGINTEKTENLPVSVEKRKSKLKAFFFGWVKDNYDKVFLGILILAFVIRFIIFIKTLNQPIWWDAADYLTAAKKWAGLNPNMLDMWYYRRGFFWPLFGAIMFKVGLGEAGISFFGVLFATGIVAVSYFLIRDMFNKKLALLTSIGLTFSWVILFFTGRVMTEIPASFFLLMFLFLFWKGYVLKKGDKFLYFSAIFYALAILTRMQYLMFAVPILILIFVKEKFKFIINKKLWITLGIFAIIMIPQLVMHYQHFGNPLADLTKYYLGVGASQSGEIGVKLAKTSDLFLYFNNLPYTLDGNQNGYSTLLALSPVYVLFIIGFFFFFADLFLGLDKLFKNEEIQKRFFIFIWIVSAFLFLGYIAPQLEQRYIMQTLPFLFLISVYSLPKISDIIRKKTKLNDRTLLIMSVILLIALLIPNLIFANNLIEAKKTSYLEVKQSGEWIKENSNLTDVVISGSLPQTTYYSERPTYPFGFNYRRDINEEENESNLDKLIAEKHPRYMIMSIFEPQPDWVYQYPQKHNDTLIPVKVYSQGEQTTLVIYEFKYD